MSFKKGDTVKYEKQIMFKGTVTLESKVVAVTDRTVLLESGDSFPNLNY